MCEEKCEEKVVRDCGERNMTRSEKFRKELEKLINSLSIENGSNTPDFILAEYLSDSLDAFDKAVVERTAWYSPRTEEQADLGDCQISNKD